MERPIEKITPFIVMDILARARQMPDAVHMEVGEPDLPPSERVTEAYIKAIKDRRFFYTPAKGLPELRERIAEYYSREYRVNVSPERIIITPGTSGAFLVVFALLTNEDRTLVLTDPSYPCYKNFMYFLNREPLFVPVSRDTDYELRAEMLDALQGIGAVMISSPSNPTGGLYSEETLKNLIFYAEEHGYWFISDEIYHGLVYEGRARSALEYSDNVVVINSFSKYFCMPGFRIGWMILPEALVRKAEVVVQNIFIAANTPAQYAALEAFDAPYLLKVRETFKERRDYLYNALRGIFEIDVFPEGAFYIWADISRYSNDSLSFAERLLAESKVAVTPGVDFGSNETANHIRLAYTRSISELQEGVERIKAFIERL